MPTLSSARVAGTTVAAVAALALAGCSGRRSGRPEQSRVVVSVC
nr:hypothetical protein [Propionicimonas sp.]